MRHHLFRGAFAVGNVLVDIDNRFGDGGFFVGGEETRAGERGGAEQRGAGGEKIAAGQIWGTHGNKDTGGGDIILTFR